MGSLHTLSEISLPGLKPWGRCWETRSRLVAGVLFVFGVIALENPWMVLVAFSLVLGAALAMGLGLPFLVKRLALLAPFLFFMTVPVLLGGGLPPAADRYTLAALVTLKALTSMTVMLLLLVAQPPEELLQGMAGLGMPPKIIAVLFLAYRYCFLFIQEIKNTRRALVSRLFSGGLDRRSLGVYGEVSGGLLIKSLDRSEQVYRAMAGRCFQGRVPVGQGNRGVTGKDLAKSLGALTLVTALLLVERLVLK